jgi:hypothetical protein
MADECLAAVPEIEGIDYTLQEYLELLKHIKQVCWRIHIFFGEISVNRNRYLYFKTFLNLQAVVRLGASDWNPHQIELALWTHNVLLTHKPDLLKTIPGIEGSIPVSFL